MSARPEVLRPYRHLVLDDLACSADPYPAYAALRSRGVHRRADGRWVVAGAADVGAVLDDPAALVPCPVTGDAVLDAARAAMARFSLGDAHGRRRAAVCDRLRAAGAVDVRAGAAELAAGALAQAGSGVDVVALARQVTVVTLAGALGLRAPVACAAPLRVLGTALAPERHTRPPAPALAHRALAALRYAAPATAEEEQINLVALLHQARDATAGLVASTLRATEFAGGSAMDAADVVREANRWDPPVQHTVRVAGGAMRLGDVTIEAGGRWSSSSPPPGAIPPGPTIRNGSGPAGPRRAWGSGSVAARTGARASSSRWPWPPASSKRSGRGCCAPAPMRCATNGGPPCASRRGSGTCPTSRRGRSVRRVERPSPPTRQAVACARLLGSVTNSVRSARRVMANRSTLRYG